MKKISLSKISGLFLFIFTLLFPLLISQIQEVYAGMISIPVSPPVTSPVTPSNTPIPTIIPTSVNCSLIVSNWRITSVIPNYTRTGIGFTINGYFPNMDQCGSRTTTYNPLSFIANNSASVVNVYYWGNQVQSANVTQVVLKPTYSYTNGNYFTVIQYCVGFQTAGTCKNQGVGNVKKDFTIQNPVSTPTPTKVIPPAPTPKPNIPPILTGGPLLTGSVGRPYQSYIEGYDLNKNDKLSMQITNLPEGLSQGPCGQSINLDKANIRCLVYGTPKKPGFFMVNVRLFDGKTNVNRTYPLLIFPKQIGFR